MLHGQQCVRLTPMDIITPGNGRLLRTRQESGLRENGEASTRTNTRARKPHANCIHMAPVHAWTGRNDRSADSGQL